MIDSPGTAQNEQFEIPDFLPVVPLKDAVVFPYIIVPLSVGRHQSVLAVERALADDQMLMLVAQKSSIRDEPDPAGLHSVGTAASIMRMLKLPDGRIRLLVQGLSRARIEHFSQTEPFWRAKIEALPPDQPNYERLEVKALVRAVRENLERTVHLGKSISSEVMVIAANVDDPGRLADLAASNLELKLEEGQAILEEADALARLRRVNACLLQEIEVLTVQAEISSQARNEMDKSHREYFLRQQLKAIQEELGEGEELGEEVAGYRRQAKKKQLPEEAHEELERQIRRLERSHPDGAESSIIRTYLDWLTSLPWQTFSTDRLDIDRAQKILDQDHFDLEKVKERILEYLAVRKLRPEARGPILCFVGPPGVGKTSLGRSIARALGRRFVRTSLGGVRDEAEIRGHRRTYVGSLPGRILQGIHQAGTSNPIFMLDEIDKVGSDWRGDPSSALLEVLDPEQNFSFRDHYLGVAYDLSRVLFIATANLMEPIQPAFRDRMEVIRISGYTEEEKLHIARGHLLPKLRNEHGVNGSLLSFTAPGIRKVIGGYTKEAGVRNLERELASICRKMAVRVARDDRRPLRVTPSAVESFLGPVKHFAEELLGQDRVGVATGLAWTEAGGDVLFIEALALPGKDRLRLTGSLGDVMKESAQAALSFARSYVSSCDGVAPEPSTDDIHIHVPAGSVPKDGPSAGITLATAMVSVLTGRPVNRKVAMTGEITLRGDILPIGGLKEKVLAARSAGVHTVILPRLNQRDLQEVPPALRGDLDFRLVDHMSDVLDIALLPGPGSP